MSSLLNTWSGKHSVIPSLQSWKLVDIDSGPECGGHPSPVGDIGDSASIPDKISGGRFLKMCVEDAVETTSFVGVSLNSVFDTFWGVAGEVICLSLHWTDT